MNQTVISGNIVNELTLKQTQGGKDYVMFSVAVKRNYKNLEGEYETDFFNVVAYSGQAKYLVNFSGKGMKVCVSGQLRNRTYTNKEGQKVRITEIIASNVDLMSKPKTTVDEMQTVMPQHIEVRPATPQNVQVRPVYPQTNVSYPQTNITYGQNYKTQYESEVKLNDNDIYDAFGQGANISEDSLPF